MIDTPRVTSLSLLFSQYREGDISKLWNLAKTLERELATSEKARRDEESWWKERHDYKDRAEKAESAIIDIREKASLVAGNGAEERDRFLGRQIILLCEKALSDFNPPAMSSHPGNFGPRQSLGVPVQSDKP